MKPLFFTVIYITMTLSVQAAGNERNPFQPEPQVRLSGELFTFSIYARGSQYFNDEWFFGNVLLVSGDVVENQRLKYNGYLDELIWLNPSFQQVKVDKNMVKEFTLHDHHQNITHVFQNISISQLPGVNTPNIFARRLYSKNGFALMVFDKVINAGETREIRGNALIAREVLMPDPLYFIMMDSHETLTFKRLSRKVFYNLFPEHKKELRQAFRQKNLRMRNEQELIEAIRIIENLVL